MLIQHIQNKLATRSIVGYNSKKTNPMVRATPRSRVITIGNDH